MHLAENATSNLQLVGPTEKHYYELVHSTDKRYNNVSQFLHLEIRNNISEDKL